MDFHNIRTRTAKLSMQASQPDMLDLQSGLGGIELQLYPQLRQAIKDVLSRRVEEARSREDGSRRVHIVSYDDSPSHVPWPRLVIVGDGGTSEFPFTDENRDALCEMLALRF